jgi:AcrR family transcriptional regulator
MTIDGRVARGDRTRAAVLDGAVALATEEGLDGLSLGQLAVTLGVSKSGLFAHWRSKEELQLATIDRAREQWLTHVIGPALQVPRGLRRLRALHDIRMDFYAADVLPGGCFFANAEFEYNARPGAVRDRLVEIFGEWMALLERLIGEAIALGELPADVDVKQLAYEIEALGLTAVMQARFLAPGEVYGYARTAVRDRLDALAVAP